MTDVATWAQAYRGAWQDGDADAAGALFTEDATYQVTPFDEPLRGRAAIEDYWRTVTGRQDGRAVTCTVIATGAEEDVIHFRTELVGDPTAGCVDGVLAVRLAPDGRCTALREWWHTDSAA